MPPFKRAWIAPMRGTPEDSNRYCRKSDPNPFVIGKCPSSKSNSSLLDATRKILSGASLYDLTRDEDTAKAYVIHHRGFTALSALISPARSPAEPPIVFWLYGKTGRGKTRAVYDMAYKIFGRYNDVWRSPDVTLQWFDRYSNQHIALFDDFRAKGVKFNKILSVTDRYPLDVPYKGGFASWAPSVIIFTTPHDIATTFQQRMLHKPEDIGQLSRRVNGGGDAYDAPPFILRELDLSDGSTQSRTALKSAFRTVKAKSDAAACTNYKDNSAAGTPVTEAEYAKQFEATLDLRRVSSDPSLNPSNGGTDGFALEGSDKVIRPALNVFTPGSIKQWYSVRGAQSPRVLYDLTTEDDSGDSHSLLCDASDSDACVGSTSSLEE
ncbi:replication-associated protein [Crucivirus-495]|nr:replication-associated protein [Crucivirus-495]